MSVETIALLDLAEKDGATTRLLNCLRFLENRWPDPIRTVGEYLRFGSRGLDVFRNVPNAGTKVARELHGLVYSLLARSTAADPMSASGEPLSSYLVPTTSSKSTVTTPKAHLPNIKTGEQRGNDHFLTPDAMIAQLSAQQATVVKSRFGFESSAKTLEQVGRELGVTRERIRQIEQKALGRLSARFGSSLTHFLHAQVPQIWNLLSNGNKSISDAELSEAQRRLTPGQSLAIRVLHGSVGSWLSKAATSVEGGWIECGGSVGDLSVAMSALTTELATPCHISTLQHLGLDPDTIRAAVALSKRFAQLDDYILERPITRRMRRAIRTHKILAQVFIARPTSLSSLRAAYVELHPDDPCSQRDLQIVMAEQPHLFLNMYDEGWFPLGASSQPAILQDARGDSAAVVVDQTDTYELDDSTVAGTLRGLLLKNGPMMFEDIRDQFAQQTRGKYSRSSVGPILVSNESFVRLAPGLYGLLEHLSKPSALAAARNLLLNAKQLETYCLARWADEPMSLFQLWTPEMEHEWATWASLNNLKVMLGALLWVSNIRDWPIGPIETDKWERRRASSALFDLQTANPFPMTDTVPSPRELLAILVTARLRGGISWITANRVRGARIDDRHSRSVLGLAIVAGLISAPSQWQKRHTYLGDQHGLIEFFSCGLGRARTISWTASLFSRIAIAQVSTDGWLSGQDQRELLSAIKQQCRGSASAAPKQPDIESDLDTLLRQAKAKKLIQKSGLLN